MRARCGCGAVVAITEAAPLFAIAFHCLECQRRTGAPFGAGVYYPRAAVTVSGRVAEYVRPTDGGGTMRNGFCPTCATSLLWTIDAHPDLIEIALGTIEERDGSPTIASLWERSKHEWISLDPRSRTTRWATRCRTERFAAQAATVAVSMSARLRSRSRAIA